MDSEYRENTQSSMDHGAPSQYYPDQPLPVAYGIPSGLPSAKSEEDRLREEIAKLKSENAELRGKDDAPKGKGTHVRPLVLAP